MGNRETIVIECPAPKVLSVPTNRARHAGFTSDPRLSPFSPIRAPQAQESHTRLKSFFVTGLARVDKGLPRDTPSSHGKGSERHGPWSHTF